MPQRVIHPTNRTPANSSLANFKVQQASRIKRSIFATLIVIRRATADTKFSKGTWHQKWTIGGTIKLRTKKHKSILMPTKPPPWSRKPTHTNIRRNLLPSRIPAYKQRSPHPVVHNTSLAVTIVFQQSDNRHIPQRYVAIKWNLAFMAGNTHGNLNKRYIPQPDEPKQNNNKSAFGPKRRNALPT